MMVMDKMIPMISPPFLKNYPKDTILSVVGDMKEKIHYPKGSSHEVHVFLENSWSMMVFSAGAARSLIL